ncbi:MAG: hypothetical protein P4M11_15885 [Candidatus Pacebacteria bacterium]|nr:hypothetical protein [Candidatus Paceibacterota bacterium]
MGVEKLKLIKKMALERDRPGKPGVLSNPGEPMESRKPRTHSVNETSRRNPTTPTFNPAKRNIASESNRPLEIEDIIKKEKEELGRWQKQSHNRSRLFEEEVGRIEQQMRKQEERDRLRNQALEQQKETTVLFSTDTVL